MTSAKTFVNNLISTKKVAMFSKSYCPYCTKAKKALEPFKLSSDVYEVVELENRKDCDEIQDYLKELTGGVQCPESLLAANSLAVEMTLRLPRKTEPWKRSLLKLEPSNLPVYTNSNYFKILF
uniref:Glutaredoxin-1 n=1 Tax=Ditylenchus dipsaci TaxID=166011 RepID=A0A915CMX0_9BILA